MSTCTCFEIQNHELTQSTSTPFVANIKESKTRFRHHDTLQHSRNSPLLHTIQHWHSAMYEVYFRCMKHIMHGGGPKEVFGGRGKFSPRNWEVPRSRWRKQLVATATKDLNLNERSARILFVRWLVYTIIANIIFLLCDCSLRILVLKFLKNVHLEVTARVRKPTRIHCMPRVGAQSGRAQAESTYNCTMACSFLFSSTSSGDSENIKN